MMQMLPDFCSLLNILLISAKDEGVWRHFIGSRKQKRFGFCTLSVSFLSHRESRA